MKTTNPQVLEALAAYKAAQAAREAASAAITAAHIAHEEAIDAERKAAQALMEAQAAAGSDAFPVGARVRHRHFEDVKGTVVENVGTGLAVHQDGIAQPTYGYSADEWVAL